MFFILKFEAWANERDEFTLLEMADFLFSIGGDPEIVSSLMWKLAFEEEGHEEVLTECLLKYELSVQLTDGSASLEELRADAWNWAVELMEEARKLIPFSCEVIARDIHKPLQERKDAFVRIVRWRTPDDGCCAHCYNLNWLPMRINDAIEFEQEKHEGCRCYWEEYNRCPEDQCRSVDEMHQAAAGSVYSRLMRVNSAIAELVANGQLKQEAPALIDNIERVALSVTDENTIALAYRFIGEIHEHLGAIPAALKAFDIALQYDPAVGVKRKAAKLRKELAAGKE